MQKPLIWPIASHLLYRVKVKLLKIAAGRTLDDFDWKKYNWHYRHELDHSKTTAIISNGDYCFSESHLRRVGAIAPLHPNHRLLYETVLLLRSGSVCEVGCGGGDHLYNLSILMPGLGLAGVDRSDEQIEFARSRHPALAAKLVSMNVSEAARSAALPPSDVIFTQAVLMHIKDPSVYLGALGAMFELAGSQVVLVENWDDHDYLQDIRSLKAAGGIGWIDIHFYLRASGEGDESRVMIVSKMPLPFTVLTEYSQLRTAPERAAARSDGTS